MTRPALLILAVLLLAAAPAKTPLDRALLAGQLAALSESGNAEAGNGQLEPDKTEAFRLKMIAAEAGYALARYDVARLYFDTGQIDLALERLLRAAQQGHADALRALASLYNSDAIPRDAARTYAYYALYLARLAAPTEKQIAFRTEFVAKMNDEDKARGDRIVRDWHIETSSLTARAQSGLRAAEALVAAGAH